MGLINAILSLAGFLVMILMVAESGSTTWDNDTATRSIHSDPMTSLSKDGDEQAEIKSSIHESYYGNLRNRREFITETEIKEVTQANPTGRSENDQDTFMQWETTGNATLILSDAPNASISHNKSKLCQVSDPNSTDVDASSTSVDIDSTLCPVSQQELRENRKVWEEGLLSYKRLDDIRTLSRWIIVAIAMPGPFLAILSAVVFTTRRMKTRVSGLVVTFNICEGMKTTFYIIHRIWKLILGNALITWSSPYAYYFIFVITWVPDCFGRISLLTNMLISIDRFIKLAFPIKGMHWKVIVYPKLAVALCVILPVIVNCSNLFMILAFIRPKLDMSVSFIPEETLSMIALTDPFVFGIYGQIYIISSICFRYIPLAISITLSMAAVISVYRQQRGQTLSAIETPKARNKTRQNNTMIVVSILIFSFLVSIKPLGRVIGLLHPTIGEGKRDMYIYVLLSDFTLFFDNASSIQGFITYFVLGSYFRMSLRELFQNSNDKTGLKSNSNSLK